MRKKKIWIYTNVIKDSKHRLQFPYGIAQFQARINTVISSHTYQHAIQKAVEGDLMIWAFRNDEEGKDCWYLTGDGFVTAKYREQKEDSWTFQIYGGRLYPRMVKLSDLSFASEVKKDIHVGAELTWEQYKELLDKASEAIST